MHVHRPRLGTLTRVGVAVALVLALVHAVQVADRLEQSATLGALFAAEVVGAVTAAVALVQHRRSGWALGGVLGAAALLGLVLATTTGAEEDRAAWSDASTLATLLAAAAFAATAASWARHVTYEPIP